MEQNSLMELPTGKLLDKFGSGGHKPGSGSAAALMGILSGKLVVTVTALSLTKQKYRNDWPKIEYIKGQIENEIEPELKRLFEYDSQVFDQVIKLRVKRDQAKSEKEKRKFREEALEKLREATEIPRDICTLCLKLIDHGVGVFDIGFQSARGDTGAAVSAAVAGAMSSIFVINLNLRSFRGSEWANEMRNHCDRLHKELEEKQMEAFGRVTTLKEEDVESMQFSFEGSNK